MKTTFDISNVTGQMLSLAFDNWAWYYQNQKDRKKEGKKERKKERKKEKRIKKKEKKSQMCPLTDHQLLHCTASAPDKNR